MAVLIMVNLISLFLCYYVAKRRKANVPFWTLVALIAGPFALPFVFFAKPITALD